MLKRILVGVIFVPLIVLLVVLGPAWGFALFVALITAVASWELLHAMAQLPLRLYLTTSAAAAILPLGFWAGTAFGVKTLGFAALGLFVLQCVEAILAYDSHRAMPYDTVLKSLFAGILMPAFLSSLVILMGDSVQGHGRMYVMMTIGLCFITDAGAYFAGVLCGKHRGITRVSPNKSLEGYLGGLAVGAAFAVVYGLVLHQRFGLEVRLPLLAVYGIAGALVTEIGDLSFSLIKRECGIKDYGKLLPGHGGMMDRFDSMVFCAPVIMLLSQCVAPF